MVFAANLRKIRRERNLTQQEVANYLGVTRQAVASYEKGKREPNLSMIMKISEFFDVSVDYLLGISQFKAVNAKTVGDNIKIIQDSRSYKELADDILEKTGVEVFPDIIRMYVEGERVPHANVIKGLAKYAGVHESFFYNKNTNETLREERELFERECEQNIGFQVMLSSIDDRKSGQRNIEN